MWDAIVYDAELDQLYLGVGNGNPWNHGIRSNGEGDNLFLSSIVALKPDTGEYVWHYQETPAESWDYTATQPIILATETRGGKERKVLYHAPKNGFFFTIDRLNGKLLSANPFIDGITWAKLDDPQLMALKMTSGEFDFAFPREQRHGAHLAQIHANGIVRAHYCDAALAYACRRNSHPPVATDFSAVYAAVRAWILSIPTGATRG